ncbi:MAG: hypothetical protein ABIJ16_04965 [Bacteroidota bacterium]
MRISAIYIFFFLCISAFSQEDEPDRKDIRPVNEGYYVNPIPINDGVLLTNDRNSALYVLRKGEAQPEELLAGPAVLKYVNLSSDKKHAGVIMKNDSGMLVPCIFDIEQRRLKELHEPVPSCTEVGFNGQQAVFAIGQQVYFITNENEKSFLADDIPDRIALSPDGLNIAISTIKASLVVIETNTGKQNIITGAGGGMCPRWSPDGSMLVFSNGLELLIWQRESGDISNIGPGGNPDWTADSKKLVFQRSNPIKLKFVNADLYLSSPGGDDIIQLTNTINTYEMQPVFGLNNDLYFMTFEDRQLVYAIFSEDMKNLEKQEVLLKKTQ